MMLTHPDWNPRVRDKINEFIKRYAHTEHAYACFDFDNTSSIFDVEEQLLIYQLETMAFAVDVEGLKTMLLADLDPTPLILDYIADISTAYSVLYSKYGPFSAQGVNPSVEAELQQDPYWQEFATKMRVMYDVVSSGGGSASGKRLSKSYAWELYWFTGMTSDEVYQLAKRSHARYGTVKTYLRHLTSPAEFQSKIGVTSGSWVCGVSVPQNTIELWKALSESQIDVWIVSASAMEPIKAAVDHFGLHPYVKGVLAMTIAQDASLRYIPQFDPLGVGELALSDGSWQKMDLPLHSMTYRSGKVSAIENALFPLYDNHGPLAGFMDAVGDFFFCTVFESLRLVLCYNRAASPITDGAGLIATVAKYMESPGCPICPNDTLYLLQGRDENNLRVLHPSDHTVRLGQTNPQLFADESNEKMLIKWLQEKPTIKEAIDQNFVGDYDGYHSHLE